MNAQPKKAMVLDTGKDELHDKLSVITTMNRNSIFVLLGCDYKIYDLTTKKTQSWAVEKL